MRGEITWAGVALSSLGNVLIEEAPETNRPARKVDRYEVPGRNGDIVVPQNAWENVTRNYELMVYAGDYNQMASALMAWLYAPSGYQRLEDSFDSLVYRKAYVSEDTDVDNIMNTDGKCSVEFECDPRRFLLSGETASFSVCTFLKTPPFYSSALFFTTMSRIFVRKYSSIFRCSSRVRSL